jgi:hypothetical protein
MISGQPQRLKESPFAGGYSAELYWESRRIRELIASALGVLRAGGSVWVKGAPGSGRQAFMNHLAAKASSLALPVAVINSPPPTDGEVFIEALFRRLSDKSVPPTHIEKCESLYAVLLDGLWRGGAVFALTAPDPLAGGALKEAQILIGLKVLEQPLASFVFCGEGRAPLDGMTSLELAPYTAEELGRILNHRLVMSANAGLLEPSEVAKIAEGATGPSDLMARGEIALGRLLYKSAGEGAGDAAQKPPRDLFSPEEVARVSKLLQDI